jgi:hypothetical protein
MQDTPGRSVKGLERRLLWIVPAVAVALGAATTIWLVARKPRSPLDAAREQAAEAAAARSAIAEVLAKLRLESNPMAFVEARLARDDSESITDLIQAYAAWASRGDALEARRRIVKHFLDHPNMKLGVDALLRAVALDTTPRKQDPLWNDLVQGVGGLWNAMTVAWGRDLAHLESNPKTRDLVLESLAQVSPQKIGPEQQNLLVADLIDLYPEASADQRVALDKALTTMAGPDVVEILHRRGIDQGSAPLASIQKINQELETSRTQYKKVLEQIEKDEKEAQEANAREAAKAKRR